MTFSGYKNVSGNNSSLTLNEYLSVCSSDAERKKLFLNMDSALKKLHGSNYYVKDFNVNGIYVYGTDRGGLDIYYSIVDSGLDFSLKQKNIFYLSCLAVGVYSGCLPYINPSNPDFLVSNFNEFAQFIPEDSIPYYKGVVCNNASVYYSDFIATKNEREINALKELGDSISGSSKGKSGVAFTKSTAIGRMNASDDKNQAAFISIMLFPVIIMFISFLIPFLIVLFS